MRELAKEMVKYRNNLSQKILEENEEQLDQSIQMVGFPESFRAGWNVWKKNGEDKKETSFNIFKTFMNEALADQTDQSEA